MNFIGESAFYSCISLKKINIPKSLKILENKLFEHCISLIGIYIHENIEKIPNNIFENCSANLNLSKTKINRNNKFYEIKNNCIVNKKDDSKVLKFSVNDDSYKNKIKIAKVLYQKMRDFLKMHENYSFKNFEEAFQNFFSNSVGLPKTISNNEFEKQSRNKILLFRGVRSQKFSDDFKSGKMFFATNLENERGSGIYTTSNLLHAQFWTFPMDTDWVSADYGDVDLENLSWADAINLAYERNLFSHGEVVKMFLNDNTKILENTYLLELKDIIYKMYHEKFKNIAAFIDVTWPSQAVKELEVYRTKEELLFHNSGLLTKLLGYDVLYEKEYKLEISVDKNEDRREFLIVNPGVLVISD
ncbi:MAG: leucine-rich repeat domain-containing protein [Candidatus Peribacteria bacterium]|nr:leucine-rich repeat domain-containing protein [Candidatus Peribacteria bacterium]